MGSDNVLRKIIKVIQSIDNVKQIPTAKRYIKQYYKIYGKDNKWVINSYLNNKWK
jgi:hypothetical protein